MKRLVKPACCGIVVFLAIALLAPGEALAQAAPSPNIRNSPPPWMGLVMMIILAFVTLGVSMIPSKRGHQD